MKLTLRYLGLLSILAISIGPFLWQFATSTIVGRSDGTVTDQNLLTGPAPSTIAASCRSFGTFASAAR